MNLVAPANHLVAHTLRSEGFDASEDGTGRGTPLTVAGPLGGGNDGAGRRSEFDPNLVLPNSAVRRLTPTECERLQGLPDGWTTPYGPSLLTGSQRLDGPVSPYDPKPDGPRYAACGDAVTANVTEWIGGRLLGVIV